MNTKINNDQLLLYWSGELEPHEAARVEAEVGRSLEAQAFLAELESLRTDFEALPEAFPTRNASMDAVAGYRETPPPRRTVIPWFAAAAAIIVTAFFLLRGTGGEDAGNTIAEAPVEAESSRGKEAIETPGRSLSESLFASQTRFSTADRFQSSSRERLRRIRDARESNRS